MILVTADWHLTDIPADDYRWRVFDELRSVIHENHKNYIQKIYILGDIVDRRDRHSAVLVNRLVNELEKLAIYGDLQIYILRGNHDTTLNGPAFFEFLSHTSRILYLTNPTECDNKQAMLLPFSPNPKEDWKDIKLSQYKVVFFHATLPGSLAENGTALRGSNLPILPRSVKIYSGDVHTPQQVKNVTYVGAPHPVKFGDRYPCRFLLLDPTNYEITKQIDLHPMRKHAIEISSLEELAMAPVRAGDRVRIRMNLRPDLVSDWGEQQAAIMEWARAKGVSVASTEVTVDTASPSNGIEESNPEIILRSFAQQEMISDELLELGLDLIAYA